MSFVHHVDEDGSGRTRPPSPDGRLVRLFSRLITWWAVLGGLLVAGLAVMTAASATSNILFARPFAADHELVKHFIAIAIFAFLPYCQLTGANVTVDIFTERMSERAKFAMSGFSSLFALAFSALLLRQMYLGMQSYLGFPEVTPVLKLPLWTAFPPILVSLFLLLVASLITARQGWRGMRGHTPASAQMPLPPTE